MYKSILVPVDVGSPEQGRKTIALARGLRGKGTRIVLLTAVEDVPAFILAQLPAGVVAKSQAQARSELEAIARDAGIDAEIEVRLGHPAAAILTVAEEMDIDLIIVASHRPGLQNYFLGSTASRVVGHASCSVLVAR